jgi:superfamily II DNA or RNA helicase
MGVVGMIAKLVVENSLTKVYGEPEVHRVVDTALRFNVPNADIIRRRMGPRGAFWNGTKSFYSKGAFMTGLLPIVMKALHEASIGNVVTDRREFAYPKTGSIDPRFLDGITLYDYQCRTIADSIAARRGVIQLPTGAGKTEIAIAITKALARPTLFLTHRVNLMHQTAKRFVTRVPEFKREIGIMGDGCYSEGNITFATAQTVYAMIKRDIKAAFMELKKFEVLFIDEAHRAGAQQFYKPAVLCSGAAYRFGLTATPFMGGDIENDLCLMGITGEVVSRISNHELIENGVLAKPFFKFFEVTEPRIKSLRDWRDVYERGIIHNAVRNEIIQKQALQLATSGRKTLIIVREIAHGKILLDLCHKAGIRTRLVTGATIYSDRQDDINWLAHDGDALIATNIFDEGVDAKHINSIILAAGTKSAPALFQRAGRAMRKKGEENYAIIIDFIDNQHPMLAKHSQRRYDLVKAERGFTIL